MIKISAVSFLIISLRLSNLSFDNIECAPTKNYTDSSHRVYVPDSQTAVRIAEAVFITFYGEKYIKSGKPRSAVLNDSGIWTVRWKRKTPFFVRRRLFGGEPVIYIQKKDGKILNVYHTK